MTGYQVVDARHDGRLQDDDLAQKDDFLFGKRGTEELPMIDVVLSIRDIFVVSSVVIGMKRRQTRDYSLYRTRAVTSIQLLNFEGYLYHFTRTFERLPTLRRCSTESTRYSLSVGTGTFCSSGS